MPHATQGLLRYWRGSLLGLLVGLTTVLGHVAGHGHVAAVPALIVVGLALALAGALAGHRLRLMSLLPFVFGFQVAAHWLLSRSPVVPAGHPLGHSHGSGNAGDVSRRVWSAHPRPDITTDPTGAWLPDLDVSMLSGHAAACLVIVGLVWRTDAALFAFAEALRRAIDVVLGSDFWVAPHPVIHPAGRLIADDTPLPSHGLSHPSPRQHRGPPVTASHC